MKRRRRIRLTRREALMGGLAAVGGIVLPGCRSELPPTYGNLLRMGDDLTYAAHRLLLPRQSLVREYARADLSSFPAVGNINPAMPGAITYNATRGAIYGKLRDGGFADWRLTIEGRVARPGTYSLADLKRLPSRTQITRHTCEEGWSAIAEWTGVPLRHVLDAVGALPTARFVGFYAFDDVAESIDMVDALHPQTILAYGMNGRDLIVPHGAPLRLRVETQVGYKSLKFLNRMVVTDSFDDQGKLGSIQNGWSWYAGI